MTGRVLIPTLVVALALPASAQATTPRWGLTPAGDPLLTRESNEPAGTPPWWACPPGAACRIVDRTGRFEPGETARGTVFESDVNAFARGGTVRTPVWQGRVAAALPPALAGAATPGGRLRAIAAAWTGGWGDEVSARVMLACPSLTRTDCEPLTGPLLAKHRGWYVYAVETRGTPDAPPTVSATRPAPSALVAVSAPAGPVADAPPRADVILRNRAVRSGGRLMVGRVRCERCRVELRVGSTRRAFAVRRTGRLTVSAKSLPREGRERVIVRVDGLELVSERIRL